MLSESDVCNTATACIRLQGKHRLACLIGVSVACTVVNTHLVALHANAVDDRQHMTATSSLKGSLNFVMIQERGAALYDQGLWQLINHSTMWCAFMMIFRHAESGVYRLYYMICGTLFMHLGNRYTLPHSYSAIPRNMWD